MSLSTARGRARPRVPLRHGEGNKDHLSGFGGLAALSLDALSSVAYGPEAIVVVLVAAGTSALRLTLPVTLAITGLLQQRTPGRPVHKQPAARANLAQEPRSWGWGWGWVMWRGGEDGADGEPAGGSCLYIRCRSRECGRDPGRDRCDTLGRARQLCRLGRGYVPWRREPERLHVRRPGRLSGRAGQPRHPVPEHILARPRRPIGETSLSIRPWKARTRQAMRDDAPVKLDGSGHVVLGHLAARLRRHKIRLLPFDRTANPGITGDWFTRRGRALAGMAPGTR